MLGAAVVFAVLLARHERLPRSAATWAHIAVAALFANAASYLLFALGDQHVASSTAGMLNATTRLWTVVLALAARHQRRSVHIGTGAAYVLNHQIISNEGATIASTVTYLLPVVAIVLGIAVLGEQVTVRSSLE